MRRVGLKDSGPVGDEARHQQLRIDMVAFGLCQNCSTCEWDMLSLHRSTIGVHEFASRSPTVARIILKEHVAVPSRLPANQKSSAGGRERWEGKTEGKCVICGGPPESSATQRGISAESGRCEGAPCEGPCWDCVAPSGSATRRSTIRTSAALAGNWLIASASSATPA